ncbi:MAG TPA: GH25 family lysozyme [Terriglobia bacterium]|nr:GH25 family lysozyme [Terriglobia bacterium]
MSSFSLSGLWDYLTGGKGAPNRAPASPPSPITGIDVSHHQGQIAWPLVAQAGITFAFAKATEGATFVDPQFAANWAGMKNAGIFRGAYHFFRPADPVDAQVENFAGAVGAIEDSDLPPVLDLEEAKTPGGDEWDAIPGEQRVPLALRWLRGIEGRLGRKPIIYVRRGFVASMLPNPGPLAEYPLWVAHYTLEGAPAAPGVWPGWIFWQHSQQGSIAGVTGHVDLDRFNGTIDALPVLAAKSPAPARAAAARNSPP